MFPSDLEKKKSKSALIKKAENKSCNIETYFHISLFLPKVSVHFITWDMQKLNNVYALKILSHHQGVSWMVPFIMCPTAL